MKPGEVSQTALASAMFRAAHQHVFDGPVIYDDPFALEFLGMDATAVSEFLANSPVPLLPTVSAYFALRHRVCEERLLSAIERGVDQVVLLGAGLDSFALKRPDVADEVLFIEVDHPDTQSWKLNRCNELDLSPPPVRYVPVDFEQQSLESELASAGLDMRREVFFSWLGISQYIREEATRDLLNFLGSAAPGSEVVLDIIVPFDEVNEPERSASQICAAGSASRDEPWIAFYSPGQIAGTLEACGFREIEFITGERANSYFMGQPTTVVPMTGWQIVRAEVAARTD